MTNLKLVDGSYEEILGDEITVARGLTADGGPLYPPDEWFADPQLQRPTPMTVTSDGRIYGHIAPWNVSHIGLPPGTKPPHSESDYAFFKTGILQTKSGKEVPVGQLTLAGGHAPLNAAAGDAVAHYDDTASSVADVACGEDPYGIWVSGGLRPGVTEEQIRTLRASAPSGDWRPINGTLELVAVCQVNTPGFPLARAQVASGQMLALVAAGAKEMYALQQQDIFMRSLTQVSERVAAVESMIASGQTAPSAPAAPKEKVRLFAVPETEDENEAESVVAAGQKKAERTDMGFNSDNMTEGKNRERPDGPAKLPRVKADGESGLLLVITPDDDVNDSYDDVDVDKVDQDGIDGLDTTAPTDGETREGPNSSSDAALPDLSKQGFMPDAGDGNTDMKSYEQGPNGDRMDDDGDYDGDKISKLPTVSSDEVGMDENDNPHFSHSLDECGAGCINPAHSEAKGLAARRGAKAARLKIQMANIRGRSA